MIKDKYPDREILLPRGCIEKIHKELKHSHITIRFALRGTIKTEITKKIRLHALSKYGGAYRGAYTE